MSEQIKVSHITRGEIETEEKDPFEKIREFNLEDGILDMVEAILEYYEYEGGEW